jgi:sugar lactone lactonase YvrE
MSFVSGIYFDDTSKLLYVSDRGSSKTVNGIFTQLARIFSVTSSGHMLQVLDGGGCANGGACLTEATDFSAGPSGTLLIADAVSSRIFQFDLSSHAVTVFAGTGTAANAVEGAPRATSLNTPTALVRDAGGSVYVAEFASGHVLRIGADGVYHVIAGGGTAVAGVTSRPATSVALGTPSGLALLNNTLYISDRAQNSVFALNLTTNEIVRVAGNGVPGFSGDGGLATDASIQSPNDLEVTADGHTLFISDTGNNRVRALNFATGVISTYMGNGSTTYNGDHTAAGATALKNPRSMETSDNGFLFVVDVGHAIVRRATLSF